MSSIQKDDVRPAVVADTFYPGDPALLHHEIDRLFQHCDCAELHGEIKALVCPHAGYVYSGSVAAAAYKLLKGRSYSVVAIISPNHHEPFQGVSVFNGKGYETPLGLAPVASGFAEALIAEGDSIKSSWDGHRAEHALEVQVPFVQSVLQDVAILPIVMGEQSFETCLDLGEALASVLKDESALIVASSDLSHRHPYHEAVEIDDHTGSVIESFDEESLRKELERGTCEACGGGPIISAMVASKKTGASECRILLYRNSGDISGVRSEVVGYLSAAFCNSN